MPFIPKKNIQQLDFGVAAYAKDLRPLGLKNDDIKAVTAAVRHTIAPIVQVSACPLQRGFIKGRDFVLNVVMLDAYARVFASLSNTVAFLDPNHGLL